MMMGHVRAAWCQVILVRGSIVLALTLSIAGCGGAQEGAPALQRLQSASALLRRTTKLSEAVAKDTGRIESNMSKDQAAKVRRDARRLSIDARDLRQTDLRARALISRLPAKMSGPARRYTEMLLEALRAQSAEGRMLTGVGHRIAADPLLERSGSLSVLGLERRAQRRAARAARFLQRAAHIRASHAAAFRYIPETGN